MSLLFLNRWRVSVIPYHVTTRPQAIQNSIDTQGKLRLNLHSLSVSVSFENTGVMPVDCILKAHSHSKSGGLIGASLECQCCFE